MDDDTGSVSVLIDAGDLGNRLPKIVTALDDQSLPYSRYQTIFLDPGSSDATSKRLHELQRRRPNVRVLAKDSAWRSAVEAATGDFVLCLGPRDILFPDGLAQLLATAASGHDLVLAGGGDRGPTGFVPEAVRPGQQIDPSAPTSGISVLAPFALVRREALLGILTDEPNLPLRRTRVRLLRSVGSIATCPTPVAVGPGPDSAESAADVWSDAARAAELLGDSDAAAWFVAAHAAATLETADANELPPGVEDQIVDLVQRHWKDRDPQALPVAQRRVVQALVERDLSVAAAAAQAVSRIDVAATSASAEWSSGVLNLMVNGTITAEHATGEAGLDGCSIQVAIRNAGNSLEYELQADAKLEQSVDGGARFVAHCGVDVGRAAQGSPLAIGVWEIVVHLAGLGANTPITSAVPFSAVSGAVVDGTPVGVFSHDGRLRLDVGARRHGFLGAPYNPSQAKVSQTAKGALLTVAATDLAVRGEATIPSALYLGNFCLPGVLRTSDDGALIECYVSGLAGVSKLDAKIGDSVREPLGLQLRIGAVGDMAVEAAKASPARKTAPTRGTAQKRPSKPMAPNQESRTQGDPEGVAGARADGAGRTSQRPAGSTGKKGSGRNKSGRVVNRLPEPLRPLARQVARSPLVRRVYRQVVRRG